MTTTTDDSLDISAQLFWQSTTPTSSATQTRNIPVLSQSVSGSATGKKNFTWSSADVLCLVTIIYDSNDPGNQLCKHPIFREIFKLIFPGAPVKPNHIKAKLRWVQETYYKEKKKLSLTELVRCWRTWMHPTHIWLYFQTVLHISPCPFNKERCQGSRA
ncbi:uncharacterized protein UDID_17033 [Ustilago sp. UG-2017a]|nr:uncharacterized protein UDID_17033 [Ustilago sp. UG-2017a]